MTVSFKTKGRCIGALSVHSAVDAVDHLEAAVWQPDSTNPGTHDSFIVGTFPTSCQLGGVNLLEFRFVCGSPA